MTSRVHNLIKQVEPTLVRKGKPVPMAQPPYRTVYLLVHAKSRTGGPEALHQLGRALLDLGHDARMVYMSREHPPVVQDNLIRFPVIDDPMPTAYAHYGVPNTFDVVDDAGNAIILPEMEPGMTRLVQRMTQHIWWLSIDNGLRSVAAFGGFQAIRTSGCVHLCQSYYALEYLRQRGIQGLPLFDYTAPEHAAVAAQAVPDGRQDRVLFPARGAWFTGWLQSWAPDLDWQEIKGFTPEQVQSLFLTSKLYVDFGSHPGKDRMPREAAILGCCIVTGQRGAAGNPFDIPILPRYKFRDARLNIPRIVRAIRSVLTDYATSVHDFDTYRWAICGEQDEFMAQVARIFGGKLWCRLTPVESQMTSTRKTGLAARS
jgi:hypothetical protein